MAKLATLICRKVVLPPPLHQVAILEFELRRARDTINSLRAELTSQVNERHTHM